MDNGLLELKNRLKLARVSAPSTEAAADQAAGLYQEAASLIDAIKEFQADCKELLGEIMAETGETDITTSTARVYISSPSVRVSYDRKGLDELAKRNLAVGAAIAPFRKETHIDGSMVIRKGRQG